MVQDLLTFFVRYKIHAIRSKLRAVIICYSQKKKKKICLTVQQASVKINAKIKDSPLRVIQNALKVIVIINYHLWMLSRKELCQINQCTKRQERSVLWNIKLSTPCLKYNEIHVYARLLLTWFHLQCRQDGKLSHIPLTGLGLTLKSRW